ncbi:helix-turn-helix domain-containing protein [Rummeliibacillus sp. TYF005]|uniref:helix-turn-helix domain-containing protein n=1 Tax=Rummeliibacillus sp. TYF005 TaxID=2058214 RepID=UPI0013DDA86D|nr:helix-turn-helix transcriptional regulator [Rummeliibacillus sp. TYF005]
MKDLQFANTIASLRKTNGLTQDEVANFVGVSKAAVSKWETGLSYPDILLLPKLATYFNLTIDELLGYKPQMTKENIQKLYVELSQDFATKSFDEVYSHIKNIIDEYYSCFPLLLQMAVLLLNYQPIAGELKDEVMQKIITLCQRVEEYAENPRLSFQARSIEASCQLMIQNPERVLDLLGNGVEPYIGNEIIVANAYQQLQQADKAKETLQVSMYQYILGIVSIASNYLMMNSTQLGKFDEMVERTEKVIEAFDLGHLHFNSTLIFYLTSAQGYMMQNREEKAIVMIKKYVKVAQSIEFPITLHGDEFFDLIDGWVDREFDLGSNAPRDEQSIKHSLISTIQDNPVFKPLLQKQEVRLMLTNLQHTLGCD